MKIVNPQIHLCRDWSSAVAGFHVESPPVCEEDTLAATADNLLSPGGDDETSHGRTSTELHGSQNAHGLFAQPVVVSQTGSKLPFVMLIGSTLLPAANLVQRASQALRLAVSSF